MNVQDLSPRAKAALVALHEEYKGKVAPPGIRMPRGYYDRLADEYEQKMLEIVRGSFTEVDNDRMVRVRCPKCEREGSIRGTQERWTCSCSAQDHYTFATIVEG